MKKKKIVPLRVAILNEGAALTTGNRQDTYGSAVVNMRHFAKMLTAYFNHKLGSAVISAEEAAQIMVIAKVSRTVCGQNFHKDNYVDAATYSAIAGECKEWQKNHGANS